jgi:uncharacterized protein YecE (DUF72 family)
MIRIGTCGFAFDDWKGTVYPQKIKNSEMLNYYEKKLGFDTLEIDSSYYSMLSQKVVHNWVAKTDKNFLFAIKCHKDTTLNSNRPIDPTQIDNSDVFERFLNTFSPMIQSGKLLTFLAQFGPVFFKNQQNSDYILRFREKFKDIPLTVEFRHKSWLTEPERENTFDLLRKNNLSYAVVDEPALRSLAPFVPKVTSNVAYMRFHGKSNKWFGSDAHSRYDYFYSDQELMDFIPFIHELEKASSVTALFFNNCHMGAALKNAVRLKQMMGFEEPQDLSEANIQMEIKFE